jgi:hypothetical protein
MEMIPENKKNHLWRKVVWHTDPDKFPLGPHHSAEVYCSEESNGYAVWYVRKLSKEDSRGAPGVDNGDYLLSYFSKARRDDAIEYAVLAANGATQPEKLIESLDKLAASGQKL